MTMTAEELVDKPVVFALAQQPHELNPDELIATLWPLMCLTTGRPVNASASTFPSAGFARWYRVPPGVWEHGDLVIGHLRRNERGYGLEDKEWYQVFGDAGYHAGGQVCELFDLAEPLAKLGDLLRRPLPKTRIPRGDVYFRCRDAVAGPFRVANGDGSRSGNFYFTPDRKAECDVDVFDRQAFDNANISIVRSRAVISPSEYMPTSGRGGAYETNYQIFRKQDLDQATLEKRVKYFLTDELLVTKACKQIKHGKSWKKLRDELKPLVALLDQDTHGVSEAVIQGLPELIGEIEQRITMIDPLVEAMMQSAAIAERIRQEGNAAVQAQVKAKAIEIEQLAKEEAASKLIELEGIEKKVEAVRKEKSQLLEELKTLVRQREQDESRAEDLIARVDERLRSGRNELLSDLALITPLLQQFASVPSSSNGHATKQTHDLKADAHPCSQQPTSTDTPLAKSPKLTESEFVEKRLWPILNNHAASVDLREAGLFHASIVAGRLIGVPHPGWASGYAAAMGETARCITVAASPRWIDFDSIANGSLLSNWRSAVADDQCLQLIVIEGIDRCPTHAWLRPWLNILAGWSTSLPDSQQTGWPEHVRLVITEEKSTSCFDLTDELRRWVFAFSSRGKPQIVTNAISGHLPFQVWELASSSYDNNSLDTYLKALQFPIGDPSTPMKTSLACRLREALMRLHPNDPPMASEQVIIQRLFNCWLAEEKA
ncbi:MULTISPECIES: coiled-coil domain-containing protein [Pirellulaceae]|nr:MULTISPECIES: hypothetical protein [Pirellulaceae]